MSASSRSAGVRRLLQESAELAEIDDDAGFSAAPLEDDLFHWHFTIKGPGAEFEGGVYHGRMVLPSEYPFKPPEIYMSTPSGRFEVNKKICLSISSFHPETWQPSWGIRTALLALMAFFASEAGGAVGSLDAPVAERKRLAEASRTFHCPTCNFDASTYLTISPPDSPPPEEEEPLQSSSSSQPNNETTTIFPTPRHHNPSVVVPSPNAPPSHHQHHHPTPSPSTNSAPPPVAAAAAPQLPVVQHRPPEAAVQLPVTNQVQVATTGGGGPLLIDRAILGVLLALLALIVRKLA